MTDNRYISRQAVLDLIADYDLSMGQVVIGIHDLPSAQPEWIMYTEDDPDSHPKETGWIICTDGKNISVERYKTDAMDHFYPNGRWFEVEDMIAWMPLPSLPKEE